MSRLGHATPEQEARLQTLELQHREGKISQADLLELALLAIEPGHDGVRAVVLLEELITADPENWRAHMWLAFCFIYELMSPDSLKSAVALCDRVLTGSSDQPTRAAVLILKGAALRQLGRVSEAVAPLAEAVLMESEWVTSRQLLASSYQAEGNASAAAKVLHDAVAALAEPPTSQKHEDYLFELLITGRAARGIKARLLEDLRRAETGRHDGAKF